MAEEGKLDKLKREYDKLKERYNLPSFQELNEDFEIECASEEESDFLLRKIRHQMMEKVSVHFRLMEIFLNPSNVPMFFFNIIKSLNASEKALIQEVYEKYVELELDVFIIENKYSEKSEAEFIKKVYSENKKTKEKLEGVFKNIKRNYKAASKKNDKSYLG